MDFAQKKPAKENLAVIVLLMSSILIDAINPQSPLLVKSSLTTFYLLLVAMKGLKAVINELYSSLLTSFLWSQMRRSEPLV